MVGGGDELTLGEDLSMAEFSGGRMDNPLD